MTATDAPARRYGGWQPEKSGFLFGLTLPRFAMVAVAVGCAAVPVSVSSLRTALVSVPLAALLVAMAFVRLAGRTIDEWIVIAVLFTRNRATGRNRFVSGALAPTSRTDPTGPPPVDLPGPLACLRILEADTGTGGTMAVIHHPLEQTYTAVAQVRYPGIALADSARQEYRVAGWGALLAGLCVEGNPIVRVGVVQRNLPDDGTALREWTRDHLSASAPPAAVEAVTSLLDLTNAVTSQHEAWLSFTMDAGRTRTKIRAAGGGDAGACAVLAQHVRALGTAIGGADLRVESWLGTRALAEAIRVAFDPSASGPLAARRAAVLAGPGTRRPGTLPPGVDPRLAGPAAAEARWGCYRHDGAFSVTYQIQQWPRSEQYAWFLQPLLQGSLAARRSFALLLEPLPPRRAEREIMMARTKRDVAIRLRQRTGQIVPEHERAEKLRADVQDAERAAGHGLVRFTGYLTVTVASLADLDPACADLEIDAAAARLELRRLWGAQDVGFYAANLPLGLGLPTLRTVG